MHLADLLARDGIKLRGSGAQRSARCWNPAHDDRTESMSVNVDKGVYLCHTESCKISGNAYRYLVDWKGLAPKEAMEIVGDKPPQQPKQRTKKVWAELPEQAIARHEYRDAEGRLVTVMCRFAPGATWQNGNKIGKIKPFHPVEGGWLATNRTKNKRPLYRLQHLLAAPRDKQVVIVEGEKCADTFAGAFPKAVVTTWQHGSSAWKQTDWTPLRGRKVLLVADGDKPGRDCMVGIAGLLHSMDCQIRLALTPGDDHADVHDWIEEGGPQKCSQRIKELAEDWTPDAPHHEGVAIPDLLTNPHFRVLGTVGDQVAVKLASNKVISVPRTALTQPSTLISLADFYWWLAVTGQESLPPGICQPIGSQIIRDADKKGPVDLHRMVERGLYVSRQGKVVWNLGDRLLHQGKELALDHFGEEVIAVSGPRLPLGRERATKEERLAAHQSLLAYRWRDKMDGFTFAGWMVAAMVGGGLEWRPHAWLVAPAKLGKSWLFRNVARTFFGDGCVFPADPTAASLARYMRSDSLPVIFDEAEADDRAMPAILALTRIASGGDGMRMRADQGGGVSVSQPRFTAIFGSTKMAEMNEADRSRFVNIELGKPVADWPQVRDGILGTWSAAVCERLRTSVLLDAENIVSMAGKLADRLGEKPRIDTRSSLLWGAISAGHWWWTGKSALLWRPPEQERSDAIDLLQFILGLGVRRGDREHTLGALLMNKNAWDQTDDLGVRVQADRSLIVAPDHPAMKQRLERSKWAGVAHKKMLRQIEGVTDTKNAVRFGHNRVRSLIVPEGPLAQCGVDFSPLGLSESNDADQDDVTPF